MILSRNMLKRVGENCCSEPVSYADVEDDCTTGRVIEVFDDLDKVGADVLLLHNCPQSCMPNPVKGLKVHEDTVRGLAGAGDISHRGFLG